LFELAKQKAPGSNPIRDLFAASTGSDSVRIPPLEPSEFDSRFSKGRVIGLAAALITLAGAALMLGRPSAEPDHPPRATADSRGFRTPTTIEPVTIKVPARAEARDPKDAGAAVPAKPVNVELTAQSADSATPASRPALPDGDSEDSESAERRAEKRSHRARPVQQVSKAVERERERPKEREVEHEKAKKGGPVGFLNVGARPWAEIEIDGHTWPYQTPQAGIELPPGKHTVTLKNKETGVTRSTVVQIKAGAAKTVSMDMRP
jgi:hypothetical protein